MLVGGGVRAGAIRMCSGVHVLPTERERPYSEKVDEFADHSDFLALDIDSGTCTGAGGALPSTEGEHRHVLDHAEATAMPLWPSSTRLRNVACK